MSDVESQLPFHPERLDANTADRVEQPREQREEDAWPDTGSFGAQPAPNKNGATWK